LPQAKSIYPPQADSNGNSGILPPPFGRNPESLPGLGLGKLSLFSAKSAAIFGALNDLAGRNPGSPEYLLNCCASSYQAYTDPLCNTPKFL
jgi:hypothetical protein